MGAGVYRSGSAPHWHRQGALCILDPGMRLSLQVHYAICGVFDLAYNGQGEPVQVRVIGERQGIPGRYLEQIFQKLRVAELIQGKRGPGGGYRLARSAAEITLLHIIEAVEGPLEKESRMPAVDSPSGSVHRPDFLWADLASRFGSALSETSVESLCRRAAQTGVARSSAEGLVYQI